MLPEKKPNVVLSPSSGRESVRIGLRPSVGMLKPFLDGPRVWTGFLGVPVVARGKKRDSCTRVGSRARSVIGISAGGGPAL